VQVEEEKQKILYHKGQKEATGSKETVIHEQRVASRTD
jgi:hypothetical protein